MSAFDDGFDSVKNPSAFNTPPKGIFNEMAYEQGRLKALFGKEVVGGGKAWPTPIYNGIRLFGASILIGVFSNSSTLGVMSYVVIYPIYLFIYFVIRPEREAKMKAEREKRHEVEKIKFFDNLNGTKTVIPPELIIKPPLINYGKVWRITKALIIVFIIGLVIWMMEHGGWIF